MIETSSTSTNGSSAIAYVGARGFFVCGISVSLIVADCTAQTFARRFASVVSIKRFIATFTSGNANGSAAGEVSSNS